eukprot:gene43289-62988_t
MKLFRQNMRETDGRTAFVVDVKAVLRVRSGGGGRRRGNAAPPSRPQQAEAGRWGNGWPFMPVFAGTWSTPACAFTPAPCTIAAAERVSRRRERVCVAFGRR